MFLTSIILDNFKPLAHQHIKHFEANDLGHINILQAPNGFGKSSIMREMTPYPACRSDYGKHGKKVVVYSHNKSVYVLTSDFSKPNAHSFIKDGTELNISGNTDVQEDLVETHFGYNRILDKLISGSYLMCDMTKSARKELIYNTYPSSLYFILEKYKNIMSKVRMFNSQLKLLKERQLSLIDHLVKSETLSEYNKMKIDLTKAVNVIESDIYVLNRQIAQHKEEYNNLHVDNYDATESINSMCESIYKRFHNLYLNLTIPKGDIHEHFIRSSMEIVSFSKEMEQLQKDGKELRDEIEQYRTIMNDDTESSIKQCENLIKVQEQIIKNNPVDDSIPVISHDELEKLINSFPKIQSDLEYLKSMACKHFSESEYIQTESQIRENEYKLNESLKELNRLKYIRDQYVHKLQVQSQSTYPSDCRRNCQLRINLDNILSSIKNDIETTEGGIEIYTNICEDHKTKLDELKKTLEYRSTARPILNKLERLISSKSWGDFVCFGDSLVSAVNVDITKINNNFIKLINNSKYAYEQKKAIEMKTTLEARLVGLKASSKPVKELITSKLVEKESKLNGISDKLNSLVAKINDLKATKERCQEHESMLIELNKCLSDLKIITKKRLLAHDIEFMNLYKEYYIDVKNQISEKLRELESIIKEQDGYLARLNDEINPNIKILEDKIKKYLAVADQISPTTGIPFKYTLTYVNAIFKIANQYIRKVWDYDIELAYFDEEKDTNFDFAFKMLINDDSEIPDINLCSKGQKSMINLAIRLAICVYRGYNTMYPIKLDEITDGLTPNHVHKLIEFLSELFHTKSIGQTFIVNHDVIANSSFNDAKYIVLTKEVDDPSIQNRIVSKIN